jgi:IS30 family transposase
VSREIKRNSIKRKYTADKAKVKSYQKNHNKKKVAKKIVMNNKLDDYVRKRLRESWSPELIAVMAKREISTKVA